MNEKVYIISKSCGDSYKRAMDRCTNMNTYVTKNIQYNGRLYKAVIGYIQRKDGDGDRYVIDYIESRGFPSGDFYLRKDFVTKEELNKEFKYFSNEDFEI